MTDEQVTKKVKDVLLMLSEPGVRMTTDTTDGINKLVEWDGAEICSISDEVANVMFGRRMVDECLPLFGVRGLRSMHHFVISRLGMKYLTGE